jgi:hypothetical protein
VYHFLPLRRVPERQVFFAVLHLGLMVLQISNSSLVLPPSLIRLSSTPIVDKRSDPALPRALKKEIDGKMFYLTIHDSQGGDHNPFLLKDDPLFHNVDLFLVCFSLTSINSFNEAYYHWAVEAHAFYPVRFILIYRNGFDSLVCQLDE